MTVLLFIILPSIVASSVPEACSKPRDSGPCRDFLIRWYFDAGYGDCSRFWYGSCEGNANRFETQEECKRTCVEPEGKVHSPCDDVAGACKLPKTAGPCEGHFPSWYYDYNRKKCDQFIYGGCQGNNNRFATLSECENLCNSLAEQDVSRPPYDPCIPSPCGPNSVCRVENDQALCTCLPQYVGSPPDCRRPECVVNADCSLDHSCINQKCVSPCTNHQCGLNAACHVIEHNAICSCNPGFTQDSSTNCYIIQSVNETPHVPLDPCLTQPSICGPHSKCRNAGGYPSCSCLSNYVGEPPNCHLECIHNKDCYNDKVCIYDKCRDPCVNFCGQFARCRVHNHKPFCTCEEGYVSDGSTRCRPKPANEGLHIHPTCSDNEFFANCTLIVQGHYCTRTEYYSKYCCRSCTLAGQLPAYR